MNRIAKDITFDLKFIMTCHEFTSWSITPIPINVSPEKALRLKTLPSSWQIYFPAKYVMKNFNPFVTGIIVDTPAWVEANVHTNVTLENKIEIQ